jgi:hypothetical protein
MFGLARSRSRKNRDKKGPPFWGEPALSVSLACVVSPQVVSALLDCLVAGIFALIYPQLSRVEVATEVEVLHSRSVVSHICEA